MKEDKRIYMSQAAACRALGVSPELLGSLVEEGRIEKYAIPGRRGVWYLVESLTGLMQQIG